MFSRKRTRRDERLHAIRASNRHLSFGLNGHTCALLLIILLLIPVESMAGTADKSDTTPASGAADLERGTGDKIPPFLRTWPRAEEGDLSEPPAASPLEPATAPPSFFVNESRDRASSGRCTVFETLCRSFRNPGVVILGSLQTAALISDGVTTRQFLRRGYVEVDPLARVFLGSKPTWGRMAPLGAVQVIAGMWIAERLASSRHAWVRRLSWVPQVVGIAGNVAATAHNISLP